MNAEKTELCLHLLTAQKQMDRYAKCVLANVWTRLQLSYDFYKFPSNIEYVVNIWKYVVGRKKFATKKSEHTFEETELNTFIEYYVYNNFIR